MVAELSLGFWRFLLARQYSASLWPDLAGGFSHAPRRALGLVEDPVHRLHLLRNRVAHHEAIHALPLADRWSDLLTVLGYIEPAAAAWVGTTSRVPAVLAGRP